MNYLANDKNGNLEKIYGNTYSNCIKKYFKHNDNLDYESIVSYINDCKGKYSNSTIMIYKSALKKFIKNNVFDLNKRAILDTAFNDIKVKKANQAINTDKIISKETVLEMIKKSNSKDGLIIKTLFITGMRVSELISIKLKDCNVRAHDKLKYIIIRVVGKGNKERFLNLSIELFEEIKQTFNSQTYLFETKNHKPYTRQYIHLIVNKAGKRVLGTNQVHPHTLRHSLATHLLVQDKQSLKAVSSYLGHSNTSITSNFYIHDNIEPSNIINII